MNKYTKLNINVIHTKASMPRMTTRYLIDMAYQGASHDSHLRFWPGGGGVSPKINPFLPSCAPCAKKPPSECPDFGLKFRSAPADTFRNSDMMLLLSPGSKLEIAFAHWKF